MRRRNEREYVRENVEKKREIIEGPPLTSFFFLRHMTQDRFYISLILLY
jgi:hypothetical protein